MKVSRRFRTAHRLAVGATIASIAVVLAPIVVHGTAGYDSTLTILGATIIVLIWYTFFTYCLVHHDELSVVRLRVGADAGSRKLVFDAANETRERTVNVRFQVAGQRNGARMSVPEALDGSDRDGFSLLPGESHHELLQVDPARGVEGSHLGPRVQLGEPERVVVQVQLRWSDDLGDTGLIGPWFYAFNVLDLRLERIKKTGHALQEWRALGGHNPNHRAT